MNILLAPKSVQEEYTNTRTTSKLRDYGLLADTGLSRADVRATRSAPIVGKGPKKAKISGKEKETSTIVGIVGEPEWEIERRRIKGTIAAAKAKKRTGRTRTISLGRSQAATGPSNETPPSANSASKTADVASSTAGQSQPVPASMDHRSSDSFEKPHVPAGSVVNTTESVSERSTLVPSVSMREFLSSSSTLSDGDSDYSPPRTRTPHSEAFNTLDPNYVEFVRNRAESRLLDTPSGSSKFTRFFRRLGPSSSRSSAQFLPGPTTASIEGAYSPNWLTLATRNKVEQQERALQDLSESFKGVGLLPTRKPTSGVKQEGRKSSNRIDVFEQVPKDSLYMMIPLWPGETDPAFTTTTDKGEGNVSLEERKYLLVYYVPFDKAKSSKGKKKAGKGKGVGPAISEDSPHGRPGHLTSFRGCARLVCYDDLRGSGIRLPSDGLAINGSMRDAMEHIPTLEARTDYHDETVIALCFGKEQGIELVPEGFAKLGLCMPQPESNSEDEPEPSLTPVGLAAAELTWLGGMALMSFAPE